MIRTQDPDICWGGNHFSCKSIKFCNLDINPAGSVPELFILGRKRISLYQSYVKIKQAFIDTCIMYFQCSLLPECVHVVR